MILRHSRRPLLGTIALLCGLALASPALAHAHLALADPAASSTISASPAQLRLKFSEGIELKFSGAKLTGPDGKPVPVGSLSLDPADPTALLVPLGAILPPGHYKVDWHATATDTHKTQGSYGFTIKP